MHESLTFGLVVLCAGGADLLAVQSHRLSEIIRVPAPALFLIAAALVVRFAPAVTEPTHTTVEHVVTLALIAILFDGGMHIGLSRFRSAAGGCSVSACLAPSPRSRSPRSRSTCCWASSGTSPFWS